MENFGKREDRFKFFDSFESPLLNITFRMEVPDFLTYCKTHQIPPFHFFLYYLIKTANQLDNFKYRIFEGEVIKVDELFGSYTVLNSENLFNYTRFEFSEDRAEFIRRSLVAKDEGMNSIPLINTGIELPPREMKKYIFITSLPWLDFTSIQHPTYKYKSADIPSFAWGKFNQTDGKIMMPFSIQAHHGFVDGYHINEFATKIAQEIAAGMV